MLGLLSLDIPFDTLLALCVLVFIGYLICSRVRSPSNLPPGPPGHLLIGHALNIPVEYQWKTFAEWGETYDINKAPSIVPFDTNIFFQSFRTSPLHSCFWSAGGYLQQPGYCKRTP